MGKTNEENAILLVEHIKNALDAYLDVINNKNIDNEEHAAFLKRFYELVNYDNK